MYWSFQNPEFLVVKPKMVAKPKVAKPSGQCIHIYGAWLSFQEEDARGLAAMAESVASHASSSSSSSGGGAGIAASGQGANASDNNSR